MAAAQLANGTPVLIDGERAPLVGRVSMDMIAVDVTGSGRIGGSTAISGARAAGGRWRPRRHYPLRVAVRREPAVPLEPLARLTTLLLREAERAPVPRELA